MAYLVERTTNDNLKRGHNFSFLFVSFALYYISTMLYDVVFGLTKDFGKTAVKRRLVQIMKYKRISIVSIVAVIVLSSIVVAGCATGVAKNAKVQNQSSSTINSSSNNTIPSSSRSPEKTNSVSDSGGNSSTKASSSSSSSTTSASYQQYANPRFGFSVDYPSDLTAKESSDNGDGQTFASSDGSVEFEVSGVNNAESLTPAQYLKQIVLPSLKNVTYQSQNSNWYIVSWTDGNTIGYEKGIVGGKSINTYSIKYPLSRKADFDSVIQHINNSFKTPGISDYH